MMEGVQCNHPATRQLADHPGDWCQIRHLALVTSADIRALNSSYSQVSLDEWMCMLLNPCITSIPATMATLLISSLGNDRVAGEGGLLVSTGWVIHLHY